MAGWKVTRFVGPVVGRIGAKVTGRVAKAAATGALNLATQLASRATRLLEPTPAEIAQRNAEIAQRKRSERVTAFWVFVTVVLVCGGAFWMATLPKAEFDQLAANAVGVILLFAALLVGVGVFLLLSTKTGRLVLGLIRFVFGIFRRIHSS